MKTVAGGPRTVLHVISSCLRTYLFVSTALVASLSAATPDYVAEIKPLLKNQCVKCHGASTQKGGLRLDTAAGALKGGEHGAAVVPGDADRSLLAALVAGTHDEIARMPYKRVPLDSAQVDLIRAWIDAGAQAPADEQPSDDRHWSFIAPQPMPPPAVPGVAHPVDGFVRQRLAEEKISPAPEADSITLIRRLFLDLTGLPPSVAEVDAFVEQSKDPAQREAVYLRWVNQLLDSPHYGERWGRWWLDQARYADSNGYSIDAPRQIWKFRDWVVASLNEDMPFDQFTIDQIAGDLLPNATIEQRVATGFHRNTQINQEGGIDKEQFRIDSIFDRVLTTGSVWLGLSIGCAQCHDHKFDPISQAEYYRLFAFLNNQDEPTLTVPDASINHEALGAERQELVAAINAHWVANQKAFSEWEAELGKPSRSRLSKPALAALELPPAKRSFEQKRALFTAGPGAADQVYRAMNERLTEIEAVLKNGITTLVMKELPAPRKTTIFIKGDFTRPSDEVTPGVPAVLHPLKPRGEKADRLDFARWLVDDQNPLTARVLVNRVWQQYFGAGLVETENDFGTQGALPSHPELLDWMAREFMARGWSLKSLHRLIVTSATYRQSSKARADLQVKDPTNRLLARQVRLRLDAEVVRDVSLAASGLLNPKMGGAPVYPPIPEGVMSLGQVRREWKVSPGADKYRRGLYTFVYRATPPPSMSVFDAPDGFATCTRRIRSNTPLQALTLLNDAAQVEFARALKGVIEKEGMIPAFRRVVARAPSEAEQQLLSPLDAFSAARVMLNLDEAITRE
jgi:hypothetical protein